VGYESAPAQFIPLKLFHQLALSLPIPYLVVFDRLDLQMLGLTTLQPLVGLSLQPSLLLATMRHKWDVIS